MGEVKGIIPKIFSKQIQAVTCEEMLQFKDEGLVLLSDCCQKQNTRDMWTLFSICACSRTLF